MTEEPKHPGKIIFVDGATNQVTEEMDASEVPFNIRFVETDKGLVPCVKIVTFEAESTAVYPPVWPQRRAFAVHAHDFGGVA